MAFSQEKVELEKKYKYYLGKQAILSKSYKDESKPCNRVISNYCHQIVEQYLGFNIGIPVTYEVDDTTQDFLDYNDVTDKDTALLRDALIFGTAYELEYVDEEGKVRFAEIDPRCGFPVYGNSLNDDELKAFVRFYYPEDLGGLEKEQRWICEVYDETEVRIYNGVGNPIVPEFVESFAHNFKQVPVTVFNLNAEQQGIFEQIMSLQDAYNTLVSSEIDDYESFVDAYLVIKGMTADKDDIQDMKVNRVLIMDTDADASYLTKEVNDAQIQNMLNNIKDMIFKLSNCPDFSDKTFMSESGTALEYKLVGFNNVSKAIMNRMEKALRKRIELFTEVESMKGDYEWKDAVIKFTQNIPANTLDTAQMINQLRGIVSNRTLLSQIPFIRDVDEELKNLKEQTEEEYALFKAQEVNTNEQVLENKN